MFVDGARSRLGEESRLDSHEGSAWGGCARILNEDHGSSRWDGWREGKRKLPVQALAVCISSSALGSATRNLVGEKTMTVAVAGEVGGEDNNARSEAVPKRESWSRKAEFILSCMGYAIGIGNVWRFPYLCYRNGGGFHVVHAPERLQRHVQRIHNTYVRISMKPEMDGILCRGVSHPLPDDVVRVWTAALLHGDEPGSVHQLQLFNRLQDFSHLQRSQDSIPNPRGAGYAVVLINFYLCAYYNVIIAYTLYYMFMSFASEVPWKHCGNWWNTELCKEIGLDSGSHNSLISPSNMTKTPTHEFFHNYILEISEGIEDPGPLVWKLVLCVLLSWFIVFLCISRGVQSVGKVVYFTATFPFLMLFALLIRGVTLPGAVDGILFYITPKWEKLLDFSFPPSLVHIQVWSDAAVQIFYSLGPGWGGLITMASYNKFNNNIQRQA
ncbi:unnamed protein product [Darwinula stevensoni]|uniref:Transporter n=1 Tax=Darwinula stevensoni TaxID=69355 RepID=A0A7R8XKR5_9CRUS|nr:unnamed protein product [Darwinula stevensoni]CAG0895524.1 unnamed protein product [Darwinula stevensoni]